MKNALICAIAVVYGLMSVASTARAQSYSIDWFKIAGGGGTSTNGQYVVSGTIGQHDAGSPMSGGQYSLTGGFWSLVSVVQTPNGPLLSMKFPNPTTAIISWPSSATGFVLQQNLNLATTNWSNFSGTTYDDGTNKSVIITPPTGSLYFRLKQ
jgi:hypothetical protein